MGNTLVHYPFGDVFDAMNVAKKTFLYKEMSINHLIVQLMEFANKARKEGILALQGAMESVEDEFLKKAMQMAVDGQEPETLRNMLNTEIEYIQVRHGKGADIFTSIAAYAPAMGMVGTLIGLVQMLQTMDDPASIGPAMAVALLTTFYGAVIANVVCAPMAGKLKTAPQRKCLLKRLSLKECNQFFPEKIQELWNKNCTPLLHQNFVSPFSTNRDQGPWQKKNHKHPKKMQKDGMPCRCTSLDGYLLRSGYPASHLFCLASFNG